MEEPSVLGRQLIGKHGTKRMVLTDATGVPIAIWLAPANVRDTVKRDSQGTALACAALQTVRKFITWALACS